MKEIKRDQSKFAVGNARGAKEWIGTDAERLAMTDRVGGDEFHVVDEANSKVLSSWMFSGNVWCKYAEYDV